MLVVASPSYLEQHGAPTVKTLASARCIGMRAHETWRVQSGARRGADEGRAVRIAPALVVNDLEVACQAAVHGAGVARLPSIVCGDAVRRGELRVLFGDETGARSLYAVWPSQRFFPAKVRAFVDVLVRMASPLHPA